MRILILLFLLAASPSVALGQQFVEVLAPAGGEVIPWDYDFEIRWTSGGFAGNVNIDFSTTVTSHDHEASVPIYHETTAR